MANHEPHNRINSEEGNRGQAKWAASIAPTGEQSLVAEAVTSPEALEKLCRVYMPRIYRYTLKRVRNVQEAEDITSTVFEKMIVGLEHYDSSKASFATWLYRITMNVITDQYRKRGSRKEQDLELIANHLHYGTDRDINRLEMYLALVKLMEGLPPKTQEVLTLRFFEDMSLAEISGVVGITEKAVSKRINRGLKDLYHQVEHSDLRYLLDEDHIKVSHAKKKQREWAPTE